MKSGEFSTADYYSSGLGYREWIRTRRRRERLRTLAVVAAAIALPVLVAWVVVHALVGVP